MAAPHITRLATILVEQEATEGTDVLQALTAAARGAKAIEVVNFRPAIESEEILRQIMSGDMSARGFVNGPISITAEFEVELKGIGVGMDATTNKWRLDPIMRAANMIPSYTAGPPKYVTYNPTSDNFTTVNTCSIWGDLNGLIVKLVGCRANIAGVHSLSQYPTLRVRVQGALPAIPDLAPATTHGIVDSTGEITSITYQGTAADPVPYMGITFTSHTFAADITELSWDLQNRLAPRKTVQHPNGIKSFFVAGREVVGAIDPEQTFRADHDWYRKWRNHTPGVITTTFGSLFNEVNINFPVTQYRKPQPGDRDDLRKLDVPFLAKRNTNGNDEISIRIGSVV